MRGFGFRESKKRNGGGAGPKRFVFVARREEDEEEGCFEDICYRQGPSISVFTSEGSEGKKWKVII